MATEEILMAGVQGGGDRQELHERIRKHSLAAAEQVKMQGQANDLLQRLQKDDVFDTLRLPWSELMDASRFIGRAPEQTVQFIGCVIEPIRLRYAGRLQQRVELKV